MGARPASCTSLQFLKRGVGDASVSAPAFTDASAEAEEVSLEVAEGCCEGVVSLGVAEGDSAGDSEGDSDGATTGELALGAGAEGDSEGTLLGFSEGEGISDGVSFGTDESDGAEESSTTVTVAATLQVLLIQRAGEHINFDAFPGLEVLLPRDRAGNIAVRIRFNL